MSVLLKGNLVNRVVRLGRVWDYGESVGLVGWQDEATRN
jgi:hypothetical protein